MGNTFYFEFEWAFMKWLQSFMGSGLITAASIMTLFGEEAILIVLLGFLYWCWDKDYAKYVGTNLVVGLTFVPMIKNVVLRRRPYFDLEGVRCLKPVEADADIYDAAAQGFSFPSGHTCNSMIIYGSISAYKRKDWVARIIAIVFPILIALSRVMLGVHYPTDVIAGWLLGGIIIAVMSKLQRRIKYWKLHLAVFLISALGIIWCRTDDYFTSLGVMAGFFLAVPFEERFVKFKTTRSVPKIVLRLLGGVALYAVLNTLLKLPFDPAFLSSETLPAFLVRTGRYTIDLFLIIGVYPLTFDRVKIGKKQ